MALLHFLLVYDLKQQKLLDSERFDDADEASSAYAAKEGEYRGRDDLEIVLVGADSLDTIRRTHSHYFDATDASSLLIA